MRFAASGWHVQEIDGHNPDEIDAAMTAAKNDPRPSMIACKTHIALGHAAQDTSKGHGALTDADQMAAAKEAYGWPTGSFEVPADVKAAWEAIGARGADTRRDGKTVCKAVRHQTGRVQPRLCGRGPKEAGATIRAFKKQLPRQRPRWRPASRPKKRSK